MQKPIQFLRQECKKHNLRGSISNKCHRLARTSPIFLRSLIVSSKYLIKSDSGLPWLVKQSTYAWSGAALFVAMKKINSVPN